MPKINRDYYIENDTLWLAEDLLGKVLCTNHDKDKTKVTSGMITETEAYLGATDKASHALNNRFTNRTRTMFLPGGVSYVYLCYGIHHLFNIVTNKENIPHAILIRAITPLEGKHIMMQRTGKSDSYKLDGPGKLTKALGIKTTHDGLLLNGDQIWLEDQGIKVTPEMVDRTPRIGVDYAGDDALLPYRFITSKI